MNYLVIYRQILIYKINLFQLFQRYYLEISLNLIVILIDFNFINPFNYLLIKSIYFHKNFKIN